MGARREQRPGCTLEHVGDNTTLVSTARWRNGLPGGQRKVDIRVERQTNTVFNPPVVSVAVVSVAVVNAAVVNVVSRRINTVG